MTIELGSNVHVLQFDRKEMTHSGWRSKYEWSKDTARVLAIAEGFVMVRFRSRKPMVAKLEKLKLSNVDQPKEDS